MSDPEYSFRRQQESGQRREDRARHDHRGFWDLGEHEAEAYAAHLAERDGGPLCPDCRAAKTGGGK